MLLTGHTGFKGAWLSLWLERLGAHVYGVSLGSPSSPCLFDMTAAARLGTSRLADIRNRVELESVLSAADPEIAIHFAAQSLVLESVRDPIKTYATNVMGTVNLLDGLVTRPRLRSVLVATSDKVYANADAGRNFVEPDPLGGDDPYSASKAAAEHVVASYRSSFFRRAGVPVMTVRAGNVIGGGDWAADRLVPDLYRAIESGSRLAIRSPQSVRPWQLVLEPLRGYLLSIEAMMTRDEWSVDALNFGPDEGESLTVATVVRHFLAEFGQSVAERCDLTEISNSVEKRLLRLDAGMARRELGWSTVLAEAEAVQWTARWYRDFRAGQSSTSLCEREFDDYEARVKA